MMFYENDDYKFYKPLSPEANKKAIKRFFVDILAGLAFTIFLFAMLIFSFWLSS